MLLSRVNIFYEKYLLNKMDLPKDINQKILLELDDKSLVRFCQANKKANEICNDDTFWLNRILYKFPYIPLEVLKKYKGERTWANYYINDLRRVLKHMDILWSSYNGRLDYVMIFQNNGVKTKGAMSNAVAGNNLDIIKYLISQGYTLNKYDLFIAIRRGYLDVVKFLVENGLNVNDSYRFGNPLQKAREFGRKDIVNYLLEKGAK